jgi:hypothetical protein
VIVCSVPTVTTVTPVGGSPTYGTCEVEGNLNGFVDTADYTWAFTGPITARTATANPVGDVVLEGQTVFGPYDLSQKTGEECEEIVKVTLDVPVKQDYCGTANDEYQLPANKEGVAYTREENGDITATLTSDSFEFNTLPSGWVDNNDGTATYAFENTEWSTEPCLIEDVPGEGLFNDPCGVDNDTYTVPETPTDANWHYEVGGKVVKAGTYPGTGTVTIEAVPNEGYELPDGVLTSWSHDFTNKACPPFLAETGANIALPVMLLLGLLGTGLELKFGWFRTLFGRVRRWVMHVATPTA